MPPRGSANYSSIGDWRYDPRLAEDFAAKQERANAARLAQLAEEGDIAAHGAEQMGQIASEGIKGVAQSYHQGQQRRMDQDLNAQKMALSEEELAARREDRAFENGPVSPGGVSRRQKISDLGIEKSEEEISNMRKPKEEPFQKVTHVDENGNTVTEFVHPKAGVTYTVPGAKKAEPTPQKVTYTDPETGMEVTEFVTPTPGKKIVGKPKDVKPPKSPGQDAEDRKFATQLTEWESSGNGAYQKNVTRLKEAETQLAAMEADKKDPRPSVLGLGKRSSSRIPDELKDESYVALRQKVQAAAQGGMKAALGSGNFTEREAQQVMDRAFDENLSPAENLRRVRASIAELENNRHGIESRRSHFRAHAGTLAGYGEPDTESVVDTPPPPAPSDGTAQAAPKTTFKDGAKKTINGTSYTRVNGRWVPDAP